MPDRDLRIKAEVKATGKGDIVQLRQELQRMESSIDALKSAIRDSEAAFEAQRATSINLKREYKDLRVTGKGTSEMFEDLSRRIERSQAAELDAISTTRRLVAEYDDLEAAASESGAEFQDLSQRIEDAQAAERDAIANTRKLKEELNELDAETGETGAEFQDLSRRIKEAESAELDAKSETRKLISELSDLNSETGETESEFTDLGKRLNDAEGWITGVTAEVRTMGQGFQSVSGDVQEVGQRVDRVGDEARRAADGIDKLGDDTRRTADGIDKMGDDASRSADQLEKLTGGAVKFSAIGNIIADAVQDAARAVVEFAKDSVQSFYDFERSSREVFTLIPGASAEMREALTKDALALGTELGRLPDEILPSIYNALSAGVPADNVLETVRIASDAARAGVADLDSTLKLGLGVLNAQVGGVENLSDVYDQLFFIVKNGVITLPELNTVMSQVTSVAGEAGVSMQDISAAMITMTRQGDTAGEAAELLSIALTQLSTSGTTLATVFEQASGKSFRQFTAEGGTLAEAMQLIQQHAENTGQALGDMLGGGSPFFRDTQAARGVLELTGKHLEDLVGFANEATEATGSMGVASAEMGDAAELGALQAKAAWEELKISLGDSLANAFSPAIAGATEIIKLLSNNNDNKVQGQVDELIAGAVAAGDYASALAELDSTNQMMLTTTIDVTDAMRDSVDAGFREALEGIQATSSGTEEFRQNLEAAGATIDENTVIFKSMRFNLDELESGMNEIQLVGFQQTLEELAQGGRAFSQELYGGNDAATQYGESLEELARLGREEAVSQNEARDAAYAAKNELIAGNAEIAATAEDRANRIAAAAAAEQAAILANREAFNGYATAVLNGAEVETNWIDALFQTSAQLPINKDQYIDLATASGVYSEAQIRAALTEAAMKQAVEELSGQLASGKISVDDAITSLQNFETALQGDYTATLEFSDFKDAEAQARATKDALLAAEGDYSATFTQNNVTNNVVNTISNNPSGGQQAVPNYSGGTFKAGEYLLVGDGPGGQILPTTELVVFDKPGRVFSGAETNRILNQAGPGAPYGAAATDSAGNGEGAGRPIQVYLTLPNVTNGQQFVGELDQALIALQRNGLSN